MTLRQIACPPSPCFPKSVRPFLSCPKSRRLIQRLFLLPLNKQREVDYGNRRVGTLPTCYFAHERRTDPKVPWLEFCSNKRAMFAPYFFLVNCSTTFPSQLIMLMLALLALFMVLVTRVVGISTANVYDSNPVSIFINKRINAAGGFNIASALSIPEPTLLASPRV